MYAKEGSLSNPWALERTGAAQVAVASDATHGPLIAVRTTNGDVYAKDGSLSNPWALERTGAAQVAVASDG